LVAPHATQLPPEHTLPDAEQALLLQQGWLRPPHDWHWLLLGEQTAVATHLTTPAQHGWPAAPQLVQLLPVPHTAPVLQVIAAQHVCMLAPQATH
jgi:hypothetical protein